MTKIKRNQKPCICGKNVKYKKCCRNDTFFKKVSNLNHLIDVYNKVISNGNSWLGNYFDKDFLGKVYFHNEDFTKGKPIRFVRRFQNLPNELKRKLIIVFQFKPITSGGCFDNSLYLSTLIDEVEKIDGWISSPENPDKLKKYKDLGNGLFVVGWNKNTITEKEKFNSKVLLDEYNEKLRFIYDEKTNQVWYRHSWNCYGDIHFDITLGIKWDLGYKVSDRWREYVGLPQLLTPQPTDDIKTKQLCWCDINSIFDGCKNRVMNRGVLDKSIFDLVGKWNGGYKSEMILNFDELRIQQNQKNYFGIV